MKTEKQIKEQLEHRKNQRVNQSHTIWSKQLETRCWIRALRWVLEQ